MTDAVLGIDVSKNIFDTNLGAGTKARSKSFANSPDGWHHLIAANTLNCSSRAPGPRLRQPCGVCANSRQSGLARSPA
jgi:hypothetical protein